MDVDELHAMMDGRTPDQREAESATALRLGNFPRYVCLMHGRDRLRRFGEVADLLDDMTYWTLLAEVYVTLDRPGADVFDLLRSTRPRRDCFMTEDERGAFEALPMTLTLWRGDTERDDFGWAWSLCRRTAEDHARANEHSYGGRARLWTALATKADAVGYLTRRGEDEIVIDPDHLRDPHEEPVTIPPFLP